MMDFDWKKIVRTVAPAAATAFGTPAMGMAVTALSNAIFGDASHSADDIAAAISGGQLSGEQIAAIKAADNAFKVRMRELDLDLERLSAETEQNYLRDVQDARARQVETKDMMPQIVFFILFAAYACQYMLFYFGPTVTDEFLKTLIIKAFGITESGLIGAIAYFIGSSRGSKNSGDAIRRIAEAPAPPPVVAPVVVAPAPPSTGRDDAPGP